MMINVLMVEDSPSVQLLLQHILESDGRLQVIHTASSGEEAVAFMQGADGGRVQVITMDIVLPGMDGFSATRKIMAVAPRPIVVVSAAFRSDEAENSFRAIEAGAVAIVEKPVGLGHKDYDLIAADVLNTVCLMSEVKVVTHFERNVPLNGTIRSYKTPETSSFQYLSASMPFSPGIVVMGSSTGGPPGLLEILSMLPADFPMPVLVVQHISRGFVQGLAQWLGRGIRLPVEIPGHGTPCLAGRVYVAPDDMHMGLDNRNRIVLVDEPPEHGQKPAVSYLFRSAAHTFGARSIGILLSGMGRDGAEELKLLKDKGAVTFAQNEASCVVFGMPGEAVRLNGASFVLPPQAIGSRILSLTASSAT